MSARKRYRPSTLVLEVALLLGAALFAIPLYLLAVLSFKPRAEAIEQPFALPESFNVDFYTEAWEAANLGSAMWNSLLITGTSVLGIIALAAPTAFALARRQSRLSNALYMLLLGGIILPFQIAIIPLYQLMIDVGLMGSRWSLILFYWGLLMPLGVFLYAGFMRVQSRQYEEAALIDGASHMQALLYIVFPLVRPITGTIAILCAIAVWNDFFTPLLFLSGTGYETLPVSIYSFVGEYTQQWGLVFAGLIIAISPVLVLYFAAQKHIIKGFASGVKS